MDQQLLNQKTVEAPNLLNLRLDGIIDMIRRDIDDNSGNGPDKWRIGPGLEQEIRECSRFDSPEWTEALAFLHPSQVYRLYDHSRSRLLNLAANLKKKIINLDEQIFMMVCGAVAQEPTLFLGPPGFAKTITALSFFEQLGLNNKSTHRQQNYFEYLLTRFTIPEELFGPYDIEKMMKGRMLRLNEGMLTGPGVRAAFIDEVFKANSAILHTLLSLLAMRRYYSEGKPKKSNLAVILMASNEKPDTKELAAIYDRISLRLHFPRRDGDPFTGDDGRTRNEYTEIAEMGWNSFADKVKSNYESSRTIADSYRCRDLLQGSADDDGQRKSACINDILLMSRAMCLAPFEKTDRLSGPLARFAPARDFFEPFDKLRETLLTDEAGYSSISGRKVGSLYKLARARALLLRNDAPRKEDCIVFKHTWEDEEAIKPLECVVEDIVDKK